MAVSINVLFVCLGNICRSPTAQAVFENRIAAAGLAKQVFVDSCGTADYHIGEAPDRRAIQAAEKRQYKMAHLRGRQLHRNDFSQFDYILAMDKDNLNNILSVKPLESTAKVCLFLDFHKAALDFDKNFLLSEVPDPYYGGHDGFEHVLDLVESASDGLIMHLKQDLQGR